MAKPERHIVKTLKEFTGFIEKALNKSRTRHKNAPYQNNWYRGLGCANQYRLAPSLFRHATLTRIEDLLKVERLMLEDFKRQSVLHPAGIGNLPDDFSTLFYLQHYGIPTRLLDWTGNPFIALYFALTAGVDRGKKEGAAVWVLDPVSWNVKALDELTWKDRGPALHDDEDIKSYHPQKDYDAQTLKVMYDHPVAIVGVTNSLRIFTQKGVFTVFGKKKTPMEEVYDKAGFPSGCLFKLEVPHDKIDSMLGALTSIGYTDSVSYPDLHGLALEIKRLHGFRM